MALERARCGDVADAFGEYYRPLIGTYAVKKDEVGADEHELLALHFFGVGNGFVDQLRLHPSQVE